MKYFYILSAFLFIGCHHSETKEDRSTDFYAYLTDKIWLTENKAQYYFSTKNDTNYRWEAIDRSDGSTFYPFVKAKGTPSKNPFPESYSSYMEGWKNWYYFKIDDNKLILQDIEDIDGEDLTIYKLAAGKDTTIGVLDYHTLNVINKYGTRTWVTRIFSKK